MLMFIMRVTWVQCKMYSQNIYLKERKGGPRDRRPSFMSYMKSKAAQTILKYEDVNIKNNILLRSLLQITICTKIFQNTLISNLVYPTRFWNYHYQVR